MKVFLFKSLPILFLAISAGLLAQSSRSFDVETFDEIKISGPFYVTLEKGSMPKVSLSGDEDDIQYVAVKLVGSTLEVRWDQRWNSRQVERINVNITFDKLSEIRAGGACEIQVRDILTSDNFRLDINGASFLEAEVDFDDLEVDLSGASKISLFGKAVSQSVEISGASTYSGEDLKSETCTLYGTGASTARLHVSDRLKARMTGASSLNYYGNPQYVDADASGASSVKRRG